MIETDVLIVGAGPAGLAAAIALKRGAKANGDVAFDGSAVFSTVDPRTGATG